MTQVVIFYKKDGKITNPKVIRQAFDSLKDGRYKLELTSAKRRSSSQNAYFHGVVLEYVREGLRAKGYQDIKTNDDAKIVLKALFLKEKVINHDTGEVLTEYIKDTSALTTGKFTAFLEEVFRFAADYLGVTIPSPGQAATMF